MRLAEECSIRDEAAYVARLMRRSPDVSGIGSRPDMRLCDLQMIALINDCSDTWAQIGRIHTRLDRRWVILVKGEGR